jgi:nucleoside-diphosphate-sugar epimerase
LTRLAGLVERLRRRKPQVCADNIDSAFMYRYFDNGKACRLGWEPTIPFEQTIRDTYTWMTALPQKF